MESENVTRQFKLDKDNEWVAGDNFTLADIFLSHTLLWARLCHVNLSPTINDYIDRAISRRSYIQAQEKIIYKTTNNNILINRKNHTNESHIYSFSSR
ncbi:MULTISPECIES: glutathione binding-like protein [unclassified Providencia]|uniref:glutathione binding-like protein n=1 Tax=Providencia TaxID=586 RepID=UPI003C2DEA9D